MDLPGPVMWFLLGRQDWDNGWHSGDQDAEVRSQVDPEPGHSVVDGSSREMPLRRGLLRKGRPGLGWIWLVTLRSVWQQGKESGGLTHPCRDVIGYFVPVWQHEATG